MNQRTRVQFTPAIAGLLAAAVLSWPLAAALPSAKHEDAVLSSERMRRVEELMQRIEACSEDIAAETVIVSGGVACNSGLREAAAKSRVGARILFPTPGLSTDNAAMIAAAAFPKLRTGRFASFDLAAKASLPLAENIAS